jgi:hypothetical protein
MVILAGCAGGRSTTKANGCRTQHHGGPPHPAGHLADTRQCPVPIPTVPPRLESEPGRASTTATPSGGRRCGPGGFKADPDYADKDGSIHMKFGWWRGVSGRLSIQGRRLDASVPPLGLRSRTARRPWLPASGVIFSHRGILGDHRQVGAASLTLVNVVIKVQGDSSRSTRRSATEHMTSPSTVASDLRQRGLARRLAADPW